MFQIRSELGNDNVSQEQITNRTEFYKLLSNVDTNKVNKLFKEISGLNIEETWREQKEFVLLKQIYVAATTYGENNSACLQGTWAQIINSICEIDLKLVEQYNQHKEQEEQGDSITEENITPFINSLADELIKYAKDNLEFGKNLVEDFVMGTLDCEKPQKTTLEQQRVFAKINQEFSVNIKKFLPDYNRNVPKIDEYKIIIHKLCCSKKVQDFAQDYEKHQTEVVRSREESHPGSKLGEVQPISRDQSLGFSRSSGSR